MINSLTARIFSIFWFTLALVLLLVLMLPKLDTRQITSVLDSEQRAGLILKQNIETELVKDPNVDLMWWRRLSRALEKWSPAGQRLVLVTSEGRVLGLHHKEQPLIRLVRNFIGQSDNTDTPKKKKYNNLEILGPFPIRDSEEYYQLYIIRPANSLQSDFINLLFDKPLLLVMVTMMISTPFLLLLAWSLAKPARKLKQAADEVAQGNLKIHPELESGPLEFRATGSSFNQMIHALEQMVSAQQRLIYDISHELRTPLTRLQLATALLRRRHGEAVELNRIEKEALRLDEMISDLLVLCHNKYQKEAIHQSLRADNVWESVLENAQFEAEQLGKTLTISAYPGPWPIYGHALTLDKALENIVRNALRYSNQKIDITFIHDKQGITVFVDDDGPGIPLEEREKVFRPFYRTDEARDRASGGTGLGLAIVETAVKQHQGWVKAEDSPLGGLRLTLWLPLHQT